MPSIMALRNNVVHNYRMIYLRLKRFELKCKITLLELVGIYISNNHEYMTKVLKRIDPSKVYLRASEKEKGGHGERS